MQTAQVNHPRCGVKHHASPDQAAHRQLAARKGPFERANGALYQRANGPVLGMQSLAAPFKVSQPAISRHLKVLEQAGLISRIRRATARLSHLEAEPLREATVWLARYQAYWDESHERLDALLARLQDEPAE